MMEPTTKFRYTDARAATTRGQVAIYAAAGVVSLALVVTGVIAARERAAAPAKPEDPNSFWGTLHSLPSIFQHARDQHPAPVQGQQVATTANVQPAQVAQVQQPTATPYQATDAEMSEWRHVPPGQEEHYADYQRRLAQAQPTAPTTPFPTPYVPPTPAQSEEEFERRAMARSLATPMPTSRSTPDPVAARHAAWQTLHDAYVQQVRARLAAATNDEQKGQIQRDIATWQKANPEPPRPVAN